MTGPRPVFSAIVGTAGHIDHGKTALVRALTGIDTDRLPEERERGISIELGFAHLDLDGIGRVGIVDVPGHERFVRQMLAGAHGFDLVLVCVAADDGVMPQTEEHFDIVHLLGVRRAMFVVTKIDAATPERIAEVQEEIEILAAGTAYERAPVLRVSARSGDGVDALRSAIAAELGGLPPKSAPGALRMPVDRVFVSKGHGVVVTGTAIAGRIRAGDEISILPAGHRGRVREVQVHGEHVDEAAAGQRVALNLSGLDRHTIVRGDTVAAADQVAITSRLDARVELRPAAARPVRSHVRVRLHHGTRETFARLVWLDGVREVAPRSSAFAQLVLAEPLVAAHGDRFVIRDETASRTIGGGIVLVAEADKHRPSRGPLASHLEALERGDAEARLRSYLAMTGAVTPPAEAARAAGLDAGELEHVLAGSREIVVLPDAGAPEFVLSADLLERAIGRVADAVAQYEQQHRGESGIDLETLRRSVGDADRQMASLAEPAVFRHLVARLVGGGRFERSENFLRSRGHEPRLESADDALADRLIALIAGAGPGPPTIRDAAAALGVAAGRVTNIAAVLARRGQLVRITPEIYFDSNVLDDIRARLADHLGRENEITPAGFRDLIGGSRKYCIPLLDWFDRTGVTIRVGDVRRLRER